MSHDHLSIEEVVSIHDAAVQEFGGAPGVRDLGALALAILRPQVGCYDTLVDEASALMESVAMNHPFVDGNKRTAFYATDTFLRKNGSFIDCDGEEAHAFFVALFEAQASRFAQLAACLGEHVRPLPRP